MTIAIRKPTAFSRFDARPAASALGAEILGLDLAQPLNAETANELEIALAQYGALVFRDQRLTPEQHVALANALGGVDVNRFFRPVEGHPDIAEVRKEAHQSSNIGGGWHTDHSYDQTPAKASILYARERPRQGGDTLFASAEHAYDQLSPRLKSTLQGLRALHSSRHVFGHDGVSRTRGDLAGRILNSEARDVFVEQLQQRRRLARHPSLEAHVNPGLT